MKEGIRTGLLRQNENKGFARKLGMRLLEVDSGYAVVEMTTAEDDGNIFGVLHGGAIFSLLDEAFQAACNSHGTVAVALSVNVVYHHPGSLGSRFRAVSREVHRSAKTATYEIRVTDGDGVLIASCQALAYRKRTPLPFLEKEQG